MTQPDPDVCAIKVYFPQDDEIKVHQSRVKSCPPNFPAEFYGMEEDVVVLVVHLSGFCL